MKFYPILLYPLANTEKQFTIMYISLIKHHWGKEFDELIFNSIQDDFQKS